jgi:hypothetical protein
MSEWLSVIRPRRMGLQMLRPVTALGNRLHVEWVDFYGDFTMHACIADDAGQRTQVCIDGRATSPTRYRLFQQARHPNQPGAALVELGALEEGIVIPLLSNYLDSGGPKALNLTEYGWELARETLLRFGEPIISVPAAAVERREKGMNVDGKC